MRKRTNIVRVTSIVLLASGLCAAQDIKIVVAEGVGSNPQNAAQDAAQNALTNVVGSFIDVNKQLEKHTEIRDGIRSQTAQIRSDTKDYSQGSIQSFEIVEMKQEGSFSRVTAKVGVRVAEFRAYVKNLVEVTGTIYSNIHIGAGFPGDSPGPFVVTGPNFFMGTTFTTTVGGVLSTISLSVAGQPNVTAALYTNSAGEPGTFLEGWNLSSQPRLSSQPLSSLTPPPLTTLTSLVNPYLFSGTQYWFVLSIPTSGQKEAWWSNDQDLLGGVWQSHTSVNTLAQSRPGNHEVGIQVDSTPRR
jgi:hypothetical protein